MDIYCILSRIGQALPSVNHNDPIHLNSNHAHLHLITTVITASIRAHATVHSPSDLVYTTWTLLLLQSLSWVSTLPYFPVDPYLLCLLLVFSSPARLSVSVVSVLLSISPSHLPVISVDKRRLTLTRLPIVRTILSHPLTSSLHCTSQYGPYRSINIQVLLLTSVSGCICYRRSDQFTDEQDELFRPLPGACGFPEEGITPSIFTSGMPSSYTSTTHHNAQHFFSDCFRQSHGQTSALHWFGGGVQWLPSAMYPHHWSASTDVSHWPV